MSKVKMLLVVFFIFLVNSSVQAQCAMCRAVLESEEGGGKAQGINNGIMYLMIFPYLLIGGVSIALYRSRKKAKLQDPT